MYVNYFSIKLENKSSIKSFSFTWDLSGIIVEEPLKRCLSQKGNNTRLWVMYNHQLPRQFIFSDFMLSVSSSTTTGEPPCSSRKIVLKMLQKPLFQEIQNIKTLCRYYPILYSNVFQKGQTNEKLMLYFSKKENEAQRGDWLIRDHTMEVTEVN